MKTFRLDLFEIKFCWPLNRNFFEIKFFEIGPVRNKLGDRWTLFHYFKSGKIRKLQIFGKSF